MKLQELFDKAEKFKYKNDSDYITNAYFTVGDNDYKFQAMSYDDDAWRILFKVENHEDKNAYGKVDTGGKELLVFSTILKILDKFIIARKPAVITFSAKEKNRRNLYDKMIKVLSSRYGFKLDVAGSDKKSKNRADDEKHYVMVRK